MGIDLPNVSCHRWQQYRQSPSEKGHRDSSTALLQAQGMFFFSCLVWCCCLCCLVAQKDKENYRKLGSFVSMLLLFPFFFLLWVVLVYDNTKNVTELSGIGVFSFWVWKNEDFEVEGCDFFPRFLGNQMVLLDWDLRNEKLVIQNCDFFPVLSPQPN